MLLPSCRGSPGGAAHLFTDSASPAALIFRQRERLCQIFCQSWRLPAGIPGISTQAAGSRYFKHTGEALAGCAGKAEGLGFWQDDVGTPCSFWGTVQQIRAIPSSKISGVSASSVLADTWPKTLFPFPLNFPANGQAAPVQTPTPSCCPVHEAAWGHPKRCGRIWGVQQSSLGLLCPGRMGGKRDKGTQKKGLKVCGEGSEGWSASPCSLHPVPFPCWQPNAHGPGRGDNTGPQLPAQPCPNLVASSNEAEMGIKGCWLSPATLMPPVTELQQLLLQHPGGAAKSPCVGWGLWEQQHPSQGAAPRGGGGEKQPGLGPPRLPLLLSPPRGP